MTSSIPRIAFEALPPRVRSLLASKVERLGYLGEFFAATAHQGDALAAFQEFTDASKGALDMRIVELIALTVATRSGVAYEKNQHERLSVRLGYGRDWVADVERLAPAEATLLTEDERLVQAFVLHAMATGGHGVAPQLDALAERMGPEDAVAVLFVLARYYAHALMVGCLGIGAPVPSIFEDGFGAAT